MRFPVHPTETPPPTYTFLSIPLRALIISFFFLNFGYYLGSRGYPFPFIQFRGTPSTEVTKNEWLPSPQPVDPETAEIPLKGKWYAYGPVEDIYMILSSSLEGKEVSATVSLGKDGYGITTIIDGDEKKPLQSFTIPLSNKSYIQNLSLKQKQVLAWSDDGQKVAVMWPNKVVVMTLKYSTRPQPYGEQTIIKDVAEVVSTEEYPVTEEVSTIFFSGDGSELYLNAENVLNLQTKKIQSIELTKSGFELDRRLYALPGVKGFVHWNFGDSYQEMYLVKDTSGKITRYKLPEKYTYDYPGEIYFSPDQRHVCVVYGSSGHVGYLIGKVVGNTIVELDSGNQYSKCIKWLNNSTVVVHDRPYHENTEYYSTYNVSTQKKEFMMNYQRLF